MSRASIGIWWKINGRILCKCEPVDAASSINGWRDISTGHFEYWETLRTSRADLARHEYTDHPRGRVLFSESNKHFVIYGGKNLVYDSELQKQIISAFGLEHREIKISHDKHYDRAFPLLDEL